MTIQQIQYFLVLAEELHFWNTAEKVFISQSSLSRQIQGLEEELGIRLFERNKRNVKLTDAGKFLQEGWTLCLNDLNQMQRQAKKISEGVSGIVSITYPGSISFKFLPDFIKVLNSNLPFLKLELTEPTDENHEKLLLNYQTDIAFSRDNIENPSIDSLKLYSEPICLVVPLNHWLTRKPLSNLLELKDENFIISSLFKKTYYASFLRALFNKYDFEPKTAIESDFGGMIINLVSQGIGISILPISFKYANNNGVRFIELDEEIDLYINWRKNELNSGVKRTVDIAMELAIEYKETKEGF